MYFDFNKLEEIPEDLHNYFDFVVIDPPFITHDVWSKVNINNLKTVWRSSKAYLKGRGKNSCQHNG